MEKKKYEELELEVVRLDAEDVITTSSNDCGPYSCGVVSQWDCESYYNASGDFCSFVCLAV